MKAGFLLLSSQFLGHQRTQRSQQGLLKQCWQFRQFLNSHSVTKQHTGARPVGTACVFWQQKQCSQCLIFTQSPEDIEEQDLLALLVSCGKRSNAWKRLDPHSVTIEDIEEQLLLSSGNRSSWQCLNHPSMTKRHRGARPVSTACALWQQKQCW